VKSNKLDPCCLANIRVAAQACVLRLWAVAWVIRRLSLVT